MVAWNINHFRADLNQRGVIRTNRAQLILTPPPKIKVFDPRAVVIRCNRVSLPSVTFTTDDNHHRYGVGPIDKVPVHPIFDSLQASFLVDRDGEVIKFFQDWAMLAGNFDSRLSDGYLTEYPVDYQTDAYIAVFDEKERQVMEYRFVNAYPAVINEAPMDWGETDQSLLLNVAFNYREYTHRIRNISVFNRLNQLFSSIDEGLAGAVRVPLTTLDQLNFF